MRKLAAGKPRPWGEGRGWEGGYRKFPSCDSYLAVFEFEFLTCV